MNFSKALAVITGGASGLGRAVAERVIAAGGKAAILDLQEAAGQAAAQEIGATFLKCDVAIEAQVTAAIDAARQALGGINVLVNCAGIAGSGKLLGKDGPMSGDFFEKVVRVNLIGTFLCDKSAAAIMQANVPNEDGERGVIIHTALRRRLRGTDRPGCVFRHQGRHRRNDAAHCARAREVWHSLHGDRTGNIHDSHACGPAAGRAGLLGQTGAVPGAAGKTGGVRSDGPIHRRDTDVERRDHPPGWGDSDGRRGRRPRSNYSPLREIGGWRAAGPVSMGSSPCKPHSGP